MLYGELCKYPSSPQASGGCQDARAGMTLVEVMMALAILGLLSAGLWSNVFMTQRSFAYNRISNQNVNEASLALVRMAHGSQDYWGIRVSSRSGFFGDSD